MANFYAQKDGYGYPIPGTMMSVEGTIPQVSNIIAIPAQDVVSSKTHPAGLRYFIRRDSAGNIIPNSLIISLKQPSGLVYEFKLA